MVVEKNGYRGVGVPIKLGRTPPSVRRPPPDFAIDNREILRVAGYSDAEIDALMECGAVIKERGQ